MNKPRISFVDLASTKDPAMLAELVRRLRTLNADYRTRTSPNVQAAE